MKIYTKTGDKGTTMLFGGGRVQKSHIRIEAYGSVDELNAYIGLIRDQAISEEYKAVLKNIQDILFVIGANLATNPDKKKAKTPAMSSADIELLEQEMDAMEACLPELRHFILPGGHTTVSFCHLARCVCRRVERHVVRLAQTEAVSPMIIQYINRLSDYLFVLGRKLGQDLGAKEVIWEG